jgi:hypothetical protein
MPTYINNSTNDIYQNDSNHASIRVPAGATFETAYYIPDLPDYLAKTSDEPLVQPFQLLATVTSVPSAAVDITEWNTIVIYNASTGAIQVATNGDTANAMIILPGIKEEWDDTLDIIGTITITENAGTGNVYIWGKTTTNSVYMSRMLTKINNML